MILLVLTSTTVSAETNGGADWTILGIRLGSTAPEALATIKSQLRDPMIKPSQGTFSLGSFTTSTLTFGYAIYSEPSTVIRRSFGAYSDIQPGGFNEMLQIDVSQRPPHRVMLISRQTMFFGKQAPSMDALRASIEQKYGKWDYIDDSPRSMHWIRNSDIGPDSELRYTCRNRNVSELLQDSTYEIQDPRRLAVVFPRCGTRLTVTASGGSDGLVPGFSVVLFDARAITDSAAYLRDILKAGAADSAARIKARGDTVKTKF
jgi:hypothetical protein